MFLVLAGTSILGAGEPAEETPIIGESPPEEADPAEPEAATLTNDMDAALLEPGGSETVVEPKSVNSEDIVSEPSEGAAEDSLDEPADSGTQADAYEASLEQLANGNLGLFVGKAYDAKTGKPIYGVGISIVNEATQAERFTLTDEQGRFIIRDVEPGTYTVTLSQTGYQKLEFPGVTIVPGKVTQFSTQRGALEPEAAEEGEEIYQMDAMEVVAEFLEEGAASQLFNRRELENLIASMGTEDFSNLGLSDVAAGVGRMAGANIVDGKYAVIRGLADRYSNTTLNGALIPSGDPSKKAVQLDLIPTHLLRGLLTYKTFTPDLTAEFAGGLVDIQTLRFPEELTIQLGVGVEYNDQATNEVFLANPDRSMDFLGRTSDGLPNVNNVDTFPTGVLRGATPPSANQQLAETQWKAIHNAGGFFPDREHAPLNSSFDFTVGKAFDVEHGDLGLLVAFNQGREYNVYEGREVNRGSRATGEFGTVQSQTQNLYTDQVDWGGLLSLAYRSRDENHLLGVTLMTNNSAEDYVLQGRRVANSEDGTISDPSDGQPGLVRKYLGSTGRVFRAYDDIGYLNRSLDVAQFMGHHRLPTLRDLEIDYLISMANAEEDRPDQRHLTSSQVDYADPTLLTNPRVNPDDLNPGSGSVFTQAELAGNNESNSFREYLNTAESALHGKFDFMVPILRDPAGEKHPLFLRTGVSHFERDRKVRGRLFAYDLTNDLRRRVNSDDEFGVEFQENFSSDEYINGVNSRGEALYIQDFSASGDEARNVNAFSETQSAYLMGTWNWNGLRVTSGVRVEQENRGFSLIPGLVNQALIDAVGQSDEDEYTYWLPSLALDYTFGGDDQFVVRTAYGRTVARPTFYEFAPVRTVDQTTGLQIRGNQDLEDTLIDNFDLRFEWYLSEDELLSFSLFYKEMSKPIVTVLGTRAGSKFYRSWRNAEAGTIKGFEVEFRKKIWDYWVLSGNFAYIDSEIEPLDSGGTIGSATVFEGQPEFIVNVNLGYDNPDWGFKANLNCNYTDDILTDVSADPLVPNVFKKGVHTLDFIASKELGNGFTLKFAAKNLLNSEQEKYYEGENLIYDSYTSGRTFSLGLDWEF